jgi:hypothetical protein
MKELNSVTRKSEYEDFDFRYPGLYLFLFFIVLMAFFVNVRLTQMRSQLMKTEKSVTFEGVAEEKAHAKGETLVSQPSSNVSSNQSLSLTDEMSALHEALDRVLPSSLVVYREGTSSASVRVGVSNLFDTQSRKLSPEILPSLSRVGTLFREFSHLTIDVTVKVDAGDLMAGGLGAFAQGRQILQHWQQELAVDTSRVALRVAEFGPRQRSAELEFQFQLNNK